MVVGADNVCRSPYIERLLAAGLQDLDIEVTSAGTRAQPGAQPEPGTLRLLEKAGLDADGCIAQKVTPEMLRIADLVLTVTRDERHEAVRLERRALRYVHAVADFSDLVAGADLRSPSFLEAEDAPLVAKLTARAAARRDVVAARLTDDSGIIDPLGHPDRVYSKMAAQVDKLIPPIVEAAHQIAFVHR